MHKLKSIPHIIILICLTLVGCASVFNPYKEQFACSKTDGGKCGTVEDAYDVSLAKPDPRPLPSKPDQQSSSSAVSKPAASASSEDDYRSAVYRRLSGLLSEPVTPIVAPPEVLRILLLSYTGDKNELYMPRFVYMFVSESRWILEEQKQIKRPEGKN